MRLSIFMLLTLFIIGCEESKTTGSNAVRFDYQEMTVDGCQYIIYTDYRGCGLCHKGNCKNH